MNKRLTRSDFGWVLVIVTLWGFAFVPIKWALADVPPFMLAALRFGFAALPAAFFVRRPQMPCWSVQYSRAGALVSSSSLGRIDCGYRARS